MMGPHENVRSSNISSLAYDPETRTLEVIFTSGSTYQYARVPQELVDGMKAANSPGGYFAARIRPGYSAVKV